MNNENKHTKKFLPVWVWVVVLIEIVLVLFFSAGTMMSPSKFIPGVVEMDYVTQLYRTRNITAVLGLVLALLFRSHKALFVILIIRITTDLWDVFSVYAHDVEAIKSSVPMVIGLLIVIPLFVLRYLWKRIQLEKK